MKKNFEINMTMKGRSIEKVECGGAHTLILTQSQELFAFGLNDKGQLGLGVLSHNIAVPQKVKGFTSFNIVKMSCTGKIDYVKNFR